ncbi:MAG TPA: acetyl-CoA carboxylase biotin carboxyl carrier protein [Steroidobacteraceae bacterium]
MSLTAADVAEIMRLLEQSSFDELTLEMEGIKLSLRRGLGAERADVAVASPSAASSATTSSFAPTAPAAAVAPMSTPAPAPGKSVAADPNVQDVVAPLLGTFYRSPKPGAPPFVEVGATVTEDTVVAIIEVMKLMNTVRAGVRGAVVEILPVDGALVEYGEPLLRVRKSG